MLSASAYSFRQKSRLAISLSWVAGYTNVITFIACAVVISHATGNVTHFGKAVADRKDALSYGRVLHLVRNPLTKLYLLAVMALPLYHWAHRFRFAIHHQFGIPGLKRLVALGCYGTALAGTVLAVVVLLRI